MPGITYTIQIDNSPASAEILEAIREIQVEKSSDIAGIFRIRLAVGMSDTGGWTIIEDDPFQPLTPVVIRAQVGTGLSETLIKGYVTSQRMEISNNPGQSLLEVVGMDSTVLMNIEEKVTAWPNMADSDIATAIFAQYSLTPEVDQTQPVRQENETTIIQHGSDIRFLQRLAERNGFECYVENDPVTDIEVGHFHKPQLQGQAQGVLSVNFGTGTNIISFNIHHEMLRPTTALASNIEIGSKSVQNGQVQTGSEQRFGQESTLERISQQPVVLLSKTGLAGTGELQTLCQAVVDRSAWAIKATGELNTAVYEGILHTNRTVNIRGAGRLYSGTYYVTKVLHQFREEGYTQQFELRKNGVGLTGTESFINTNALV